MSKEKLNPWDNVSTWKNEKAFFNWLRSQTRRIWSRHPVKISYKQGRRYKAPIGKNGREVWACRCEMCGKEVASGSAEIDHIAAGGSFYDWESYTEWAKRILWVSHDDIRELCQDCHSTVSHAQRTGLTLEEAHKDKKLIALTKRPVKEQKKELLGEGFSEEDVSNSKKRKDCYRKLLWG